jgi:hypothetical protein
VCIENYYSKVIIRNPKVEKYKQERMLWLIEHEFALFLIKN